jgi:glycosyltransferase involved in cell wall biosynthesis
MEPTASVIVPVHNAAGVLAEQLKALVDQADAPPFEVIVVLNQCVDGSDSVARGYDFQLQLTICEANEQQSAAYARNEGAARSSAPYLLFCDADDRVGDRWVREMVRSLVETDADYVGGRTIVDRCNLATWIYEDFYQATDRDGLNLHYPGLRYPMTASFGISRAAFEAVGGFDQSFPGTGHEEIDLTARLARSGYRVGFASKAELLYFPRTTFRGLMRQRRGYAIGGAYSLLKDRTPIVPQSVLEESRRLLKIAGRLVIKDKQWRATAVAANALDDWFRYYTTQRLPNDRLRASTPADLVLDFTIDPEAPIVGGLALLARASDAYRHATEGVAPASLALLAATVQPGDVVLDAGADIGVVTLCAAMLTGRSGRVISIEPDPRARELLVRNVERHRVGDRVIVAATLDADAVPSREELSLARIDTQRAGMANALARFNSDEWRLWGVDENARTALRFASADGAQSAVVLAIQLGRDTDVDSTIVSRDHRF